MKSTFSSVAALNSSDVGLVCMGDVDLSRVHLTTFQGQAVNI